MPYLDLEYEIRTNGQFRHRLQQLAHTVGNHHERMQRDSSYVSKYNDALYEMILFCNSNLVMLTMQYFPHYPKDTPLSFAEYPYAFQMFNFQVGGSMTFRASRQIGKSSAFTVRQLLHARLYRGFASMYVCPRLQFLETYENRLRELELSSILPHDVKNYRNNLRLKEFPNGSRIELVYVLTNAGNARSKSTDELLYDEFQDFDPELELEVNQCQSASHTPVRIYAGTSKTTDTALEQKFAESSMAYWVTKCPNGHDNIPIPEYNVLDQIQPQGPSCYKCGKLLSVRDGRFFHSNRRQFDLGHLGFHIPQVIVPAVVNHPTRWHEIYELKLKGNIRKFYQEVLGIPTEQGEREITKAQLIAICTLGSNIGALHERARARQYEWVVSGCDWGGSDYLPAENIKISTTVHVMMGVTPLGEFHIIHMRRYAGMDYDDIIGDILHNHQKLNGFAIACDFGVGQVYISKIREHIPPERNLVFNYTGPSSALIAEPKKDHMYNQWSLNKSESVSMTYDAVRRLRIRCYEWDMASEMLLDFLNMYRAPAEKRGESGMTQWLYRPSPSKPNDTLQACNYAFQLGKILRGEPMFADLSLKVRLEQIMMGQQFQHSFIHQAAAGAFSG